MHEALEYSEVTVDTTEHLNELNRQEDWEAEYSQLDTGPLQSRFLVREYDDLFAAKEAYNTRVEIKCTPPAGMVAVLVSSPGERCMEASGQSLGNQGILVHPTDLPVPNGPMHSREWSLTPW